MRRLIVVAVLISACSSDSGSEKQAPTGSMDVGTDVAIDTGAQDDSGSATLPDANTPDAAQACDIEDYGGAGPLQVTFETTGPGGNFRLDRPVADPPAGGYPAIVFSVGTGGSPRNYSALLEHFASYGFVVISGDSGNQGDGTQALEGIRWLMAETEDTNSAYFGLIDPARVAATGHSQGGNAAIYVGIKEPKIAAVVTLAAGKGQLGGVEPADDTQLTQPVFYICGSEDTIVPPAWCDERFAAAPSPAWKAVVTGAPHNGPRLDVGQYWNVATMWMLAKLQNVCGPQQAFDGPDFALQSVLGLEGIERK